MTTYMMTYMMVTIVPVAWNMDVGCQNPTGSNGQTSEENKTSLMQVDSLQQIAVASGTPNPENGVWEAEDLRKRPKSGLNQCMADQISSYAAKHGYTSVSDFGAGSGAYALHLKNRFAELHCYDGNQAILTTSRRLCSVLDLSRPQTLPQTDLVYSLEVGEHIPKQREGDFMRNVAMGSAKSVIMSWATPGQSGNGHVNCQPNKYIIGQMRSLNFSYDADTAASMRQYLASNATCTDEPNTPNFLTTLMVFTRI